MRFLLFIIILTIVFFAVSPLAALWIGVATLTLRILFALAGLILKNRSGRGLSILVLTPIFIAGMIGVLMIDTHVGHGAVLGFLATVFFGVAVPGKTTPQKHTASGGNILNSAEPAEMPVERQLL
ncbi:MAG TPA: hypothetical protein VFU32_05020 [Ktedonobacterales bacterium]|nr:hypothetical protein [Ktedonobacterales bacterium]